MGSLAPIFTNCLHIVHGQMVYIHSKDCGCPQRKEIERLYQQDRANG